MPPPWWATHHVGIRVDRSAPASCRFGKDTISMFSWACVDTCSVSTSLPCVALTPSSASASNVPMTTTWCAPALRCGLYLPREAAHQRQRHSGERTVVLFAAPLGIIPTNHRGMHADAIECKTNVCHACTWVAHWAVVQSYVVTASWVTQTKVDTEHTAMHHAVVQRQPGWPTGPIGCTHVQPLQAALWACKAVVCRLAASSVKGHATV